MTKNRSGLALALLLATAACVPAGPNPVEPVPYDPDPNACGARGLRGLVGQPEVVLQTMRFGQPVRIIRPGMMVTQDYSAERLNIYIDMFGMIERVSCG